MQKIRADAALGILLGELVVHGHDVAGALGQPWPIDPAHAALIVEGLNPILPGWVRPDRVKGLTAGFEVHLRGQASHVWAFRDGRLHVNPPDPGRIDVHISADPAALLLVVYARESQWKHIATGRLTAWGGRPWLAFTLTSRFHKP
jgi:SCP-2 sterol transfer family